MSASPVQQASESVETLSWSDGALLRLSLFLSQQRCHPHRRVNVSFLYSLFSILCCLFSALCSPFSILYSLLAILCSLFSLSGLTLCVRVFFFDSLTLWLFALGFSVSSVLFCSVAWLFQRRPQLNQIVCVDRFVVANELLVLKDKQRRHWPLPRSMCASQLGRLGVFLNGNKNGSKQSTE